eukprot:CAMPEP_0174361124 /NCGR_PEP_ID=MMETSP0811_2-20130205/57679_1 /TAXON_ID=73025 ORGANISM="Eutreptiella gymnastica-like, Strain CCMP1594" /NCGR_SAMPLE_ID=MMETSP0811_2 /ASSEMBLY_ACC=CAM_ASM_000667 /LENGTH=102 /DNA_ID=CAMNT_0015497513 /DNA_START=235 /DNA_END=539 /DNA_ORIENTATION=+
MSPWDRGASISDEDSKVSLGTWRHDRLSGGGPDEAITQSLVSVSGHAAVNPYRPQDVRDKIFERSLNLRSDIAAEMVQTKQHVSAPLSVNDHLAQKLRFAEL